jgi:hypothetical protein
LVFLSSTKKQFENAISLQSLSNFIESQKVAVSLRPFNHFYYFPLHFPLILCLGHHLRSDLESNLLNYTPGSPVLQRYVNQLLKKLNQSFSLFDQLIKVKILLLIQSG